MNRRRWALGLVPIGIFYGIFFFYPQASFLRLSFYAHSGIGEVAGSPTLSNFRDIFGDSFFYRAVFRTIQLSAICAVVATGVAYPVAYVIARSRRYGRMIFIVVVASMFSSAVALTLGWQALLAESGAINKSLEALGVISEPLNLSHSFLAVVIGTVHIATPLAVMTIMPVCEGLPSNIVEAAHGLGASRSRTFWQVVFPATRSGVMSAMLLIFAVVAGAFTTPALLGGGRIALLSLLIRDQMLQTFNYANGATLSLILIVLVGLIVVLALVLNGRQKVRANVRGLG